MRGKLVLGIWCHFQLWSAFCDLCILTLGMYCCMGFVSSDAEFSTCWAHFMFPDWHGISITCGVFNSGIDILSCTILFLCHGAQVKQFGPSREATFYTDKTHELHHEGNSIEGLLQTGNHVLLLHEMFAERDVGWPADHRFPLPGFARSISILVIQLHRGYFVAL